MICGCCGRTLRKKQGKPHWIYSTFTGARYCWPGEGCNRSKPNGSRRSRST